MDGPGDRLMDGPGESSDGQCRGFLCWTVLGRPLMDGPGIL